MTKEDIAVVIPVYKSKLSPEEKLSYNRCNKVLADYKRILVAPNNLDVKNYNIKEKENHLYQLNSAFFGSVSAYNKLLVSAEFYKLFAEFKYILIYQLDAIVFRDELLEWCEKDFDFVGAPWINERIRIFLNVFLKVSIKKALKLCVSGRINCVIGNGGFSLRKVDSFLRVIKDQQEEIKNWGANEDYFWGLCANIDGVYLKVPELKESLQFAFETNPEKLYKMNDFQLPFGTHAWERYNKEFWLEHLKPLIN